MIDNVSQAFSSKGEGDYAEKSMLKIYWSLDNKVQLAFKNLKPKVKTCTDMLTQVLKFKEEQMIKAADQLPPPPAQEWELDLETISDSDFSELNLMGTPVQNELPVNMSTQFYKGILNGSSKKRPWQQPSSELTKEQPVKKKCKSTTKSKQKHESAKGQARHQI